MAWLNLEYKFGTTESLENVFKRALAESKVSPIISIQGRRSNVYCIV